MLPQFKCHPDTFSLQFRTHHHSNISKHKEHLCFKTQCILSTASSSLSTAVCDVEKLRLPPLDVHSNSGAAAANRPWTYIDGTHQSPEARFRASLASETLLTSDEAVIAAASAEAVALARAAVKLAKDAVLMANNCSSSRTETNAAISYGGTHISPTKLSLFTEGELAGIVGRLPTAENGVKEDIFLDDFLKESNDNEPTNKDLELLEHQLSTSIAVRSRRQDERNAKRTRAGKKASTNDVSVKVGSSRKKRGASQDVDYSDPLRYFRGTTRSRLLTATEEVHVSEGIQDLIKLESLHKELADRCGDQPTFAQWAAAARVDQRTLRKRLNHGTRCKDRMIKSNIRLVISIAKNYQGVGMNIQDLIQEGCRGLIRGAEKFDATRGFKFSTYAHWWIKQAVRKSLCDQSRTIRLPFHMVEATYRVKEATKQLINENRRLPSNEEVAEATGLSMKRLNAVLLTPKAPLSFDQKFGSNQDLKPSDIVADPNAETAESILTKQFMKRDLEKILDNLNPREKQVIRWRYGLEDGRIKTLQEIGEMMGVSRERIRQIESYGFRKLKNRVRKKNMQQYLVS